MSRFYLNAVPKIILRQFKNISVENNQFLQMQKSQANRIFEITFVNNP